MKTTVQQLTILFQMQCCPDLGNLQSQPEENKKAMSITNKVGQDGTLVCHPLCMLQARFKSRCVVYETIKKE